MERQKPLHRLKLPHTVIVRAPGLLPMLYIPHEIADELGISLSTLRDWFQFGAPFQRDARNRLWINGEGFAAWVKEQQKPKPIQKLANGEGFCMHCNQVTVLMSPEIRRIKGNLVHVRGKCMHCGSTINRGDRYDRTAELPQN